jgi:hypothetical protein
MRELDADLAETEASSKTDAAKKPRKRQNRRPRGRPESTIAIIDRLLADRAPVKIQGETTTVPAAEAIVLQLLQKALSGNARAWRALQRYQDFASSRSAKGVAFAFIDTDYTAAFASSLQGGAND